MNELTTTTGESALSVSDVRSQIQAVQQLMHEAMIDGQHYGVIPGTDKPTLLKAGAEKLTFMFRLAPTFRVSRGDLPNGHREYDVTCTLTHIKSGAVMGEGVGSCSTMESKYRYRNANDFEILDEAIPKDAKERKAEYRKQGYGMKKVNGAWCWVRYTGDGSKVENPDIADVYNTVLKMAKKRALVDAAITATAASDIFTQDLEENAPAETAEPRDVSPERQTEPIPYDKYKPLIVAVAESWPDEMKKPLGQEMRHTNPHDTQAWRDLYDQVLAQDATMSERDQGASEAFDKPIDQAEHGEEPVLPDPEPADAVGRQAEADDVELF